MTVISVNELITTTSKIARLHGFYWGTDVDFSELVCWLELHQLQGLKRLQQILDAEQLSATPALSYQQDDATLSLDAKDQSAACFALACMDFALGLYYQRDESGSHLDIKVDNVRDSVFFLAALGHIKYRDNASFSGSDNERLFKTQVLNGAFTTHWLGASSDQFIRVKIGDDASEFNTNSARAETSANAPDTQIHVDRLASALENGVNVDSALWNSLVAYSHRILVPATEHSRQFGTGGGNAND